MRFTEYGDGGVETTPADRPAQASVRRRGFVSIEELNAAFAAYCPRPAAGSEDFSFSQRKIINPGRRLWPDAGSVFGPPEWTTAPTRSRERA